MDRDLKQTAAQLGLTRPQLIARLREKGLLTPENLPAHPARDRDYLRVKEGHWFHPVCGMQYSRSTRVTQAGLRWLADRLGIELPPLPADRSDVA